jgi:hypothetical protein
VYPKRSLASTRLSVVHRQSTIVNRFRSQCLVAGVRRTNPRPLSPMKRGECCTFRRAIDDGRSTIHDCRPRRKGAPVVRKGREESPRPVFAKSGMQRRGPPSGFAAWADPPRVIARSGV